MWLHKDIHELYSHVRRAGDNCIKKILWNIGITGMCIRDDGWVCTLSSSTSRDTKNIAMQVMNSESNLHWSAGQSQRHRPISGG